MIFRSWFMISVSFEIYFQNRSFGNSRNLCEKKTLQEICKAGAGAHAAGDGHAARGGFFGSAGAGCASGGFGTPGVSCWSACWCTAKCNATRSVWTSWSSWTTTAICCDLRVSQQILESFQSKVLKFKVHRSGLLPNLQKCMVIYYILVHVLMQFAKFRWSVRNVSERFWKSNSANLPAFQLGILEKTVHVWTLGWVSTKRCQAGGFAVCSNKGKGSYEDIWHTELYMTIWTCLIWSHRISIWKAGQNHVLCETSKKSWHVECKEGSVNSFPEPVPSVYMFPCPVPVTSMAWVKMVIFLLPCRRCSMIQPRGLLLTHQDSLECTSVQLLYIYISIDLIRFSHIR